MHSNLISDNTQQALDRAHGLDRAAARLRMKPDQSARLLTNVDNQLFE
jgi:hypothetical protein